MTEKTSTVCLLHLLSNRGEGEITNVIPIPTASITFSSEYRTEKKQGKWFRFLSEGTRLWMKSKAV